MNMSWYRLNVPAPTSSAPRLNRPLRVIRVPVSEMSKFTAFGQLAQAGDGSGPKTLYKLKSPGAAVGAASSTGYASPLPAIDGPTMIASEVTIEHDASHPSPAVTTLENSGVRFTNIRHVIPVTSSASPGPGEVVLGNVDAAPELHDLCHSWADTRVPPPSPVVIEPTGNRHDTKRNCQMPVPPPRKDNVIIPKKNKGRCGIGSSAGCPTTAKRRRAKSISSKYVLDTEPPKSPVLLSLLQNNTRQSPPNGASVGTSRKLKNKKKQKNDMRSLPPSARVCVKPTLQEVQLVSHLAEQAMNAATAESVTLAPASPALVSNDRDACFQCPSLVSEAVQPPADMMEVPDQTCEACVFGITAATHYCFTCMALLCGECTRKHNSSLRFGVHKTERVGRVHFCVMHHSRIISELCSTCQTLICCSCKVFSHHTHVSYPVSQKFLPGTQMIEYQSDMIGFVYHSPIQLE